MKIINKIVVLLIVTLLPVGFTGCRDDEKDTPDVVDEKVPDFILGQESVRVKIGTENKATLDIKGSGEYDAFSLDEKIAKAVVVNDVVAVEGIANGKTSIMVSDKFNRYRRLPVSVYTTDVLGLSYTDVSIEVMLGYSKTTTVDVISGNGGYKAVSNHPDVKVSIIEDNKINIVATSKKTDYKATVTITDRSDLTQDITVSVKSHLNPFSDEELETIMKSNATRYIYKGSDTFYGEYGYVPLNEMFNGGKQRYGWDYSRYYWLYLDFKGGKSVGVKEDAQFTYKSWNGEIVMPITLEIIKNDGTNTWGIYFYVNDEEEKMYTGYFCSPI